MEMEIGAGENEEESGIGRDWRLPDTSYGLTPPKVLAIPLLTFTATQTKPHAGPTREEKAKKQKPWKRWRRSR